MLQFRSIVPVTVGVAVLVGASSAMAEGDWYVGLGVGQSMNNDYECTDCGADIGSLDDSGLAFKVFGGYRFHENFSLQGGYVNLSDTDATGEGNAWTDKLEVSGLYLGLQGEWPISDRFGVFATAGVFRWEQDVTFDGDTGSFDDIDGMFSLGGSYALSTRSAEVQLEWTRFMNVGTNDPEFGHIDDYDLITLNLVYSF